MTRPAGSSSLGDFLRPETSGPLPLSFGSLPETEVSFLMAKPSFKVGTGLLSFGWNSFEVWCICLFFEKARGGGLSSLCSFDFGSSFL